MCASEPPFQKINHQIRTHHRYDVILEVVGKPLVEPGVAPPVAGDQVAEPHVGGLVGHYLGHPVFVLWCGLLRHVQEETLSVD